MEQKNAILAKLRPLLTNAKLPLAMLLIRMVVTGLNILAQFHGTTFTLQKRASPDAVVDSISVDTDDRRLL